MMSRNGRPELVNLLQYMKHTTLENADISVMDKRVLHLDSIVEEVKQTEEWEVVRLNKFSDEQFIQPRICAEASQILLIAEQNLKFCSRPQRKTLRNGGKNGDS